MAKSDERRRSFRLTLPLQAYFSVEGGSDGVFKSTTLDISALGMRITTHSRIKVGQKINLIIELPDEEQVKVNARAMWVKEKVVYDKSEFKVGLKFEDNMTDEKRKFIKYYAIALIKQFKV